MKLTTNATIWELWDDVRAWSGAAVTVIEAEVEAIGYIVLVLRIVIGAEVGIALVWLIVVEFTLGKEAGMEDEVDVVGLMLVWVVSVLDQVGMTIEGEVIVIVV